MDVEIRNIVVERFAHAVGLAPIDLDLDTPIEGENWEEELIEEICQTFGVAPPAVFPPPRGSQRSEVAVAGLRRLAPFSQRAARRLQEMEVRWEVTTIGSFICSLEGRRPVSSGRWVTSGDQPILPLRSFLCFGTWTTALAAPITLMAWGGCEPACRVCPTLATTVLSPGLTLPPVLVGGGHLFVFLAALRALGRGTPAAADLATQG